MHVYYADGSSNQWVSITSNAALKGEKGEVGVTGDKGQKGEIGATGDKGQKGEIGATGGTGGTGAKGQKGEIGVTGSGGSAGDKGQKGEVGDEGFLENSSKTGSYTLVAADDQKLINTNSGVTVPSGVFSASDAVTVVNNSTSNITITQGGSVTMYLGGSSTTGNRTLAQKGICTILCISSNTFIITGAGLT